MNPSRITPSFVLSLIALVMASAGTGYAALGDGGGAVTAGNSRGEPVEIQLRNRSRGETGLVTSSDGYSLRLSNTKENGGGGAVYGCRAPDRPPTADLACLYADNLRGGKAFLFRSRSGATVGHFDLGNPAGPPFTTNATGLVTNLNADKVDGLDASQIQAADGVGGLDRVFALSALDSNSTKSATAACPEGKRVLSGSGELTGGTTGAAPDVVTDVTITRSFPSASLDQWTIEAAEIDATAAPWQITAYAVCGTP